MESDPWIDRVNDRVGFAGRDLAVHALIATLGALGARLDRGRVEETLTKLPPLFASALTSSHPIDDGDLHAFVADVARREGTDTCCAREHAHVVCEVLAEALPDDDLAIFRAALPAPLRLLVARRPDAPIIPPHQPACGHHAHGRLQRPLS